MEDPAPPRRLDRAPWHRALPWVPAVVAVLIVGIVLLASDRIVGRELELRATQQVARSGQLAADDLSALVARAAAEVQLLAQRASAAQAQSFADDAFRAELQRLKRTSPGYAWIGLTDADGQVLVEAVWKLFASANVIAPVRPKGVIDGAVRRRPGSNAECSLPRATR